MQFSIDNVINVTRMKHGILVKYALKVHLLDWKCHYFTRGGRGLEQTTLSLCHFVTIGLGQLLGINLGNRNEIILKKEGPEWK